MIENDAANTIIINNDNNHRYTENNNAIVIPTTTPPPPSTTTTTTNDNKRQRKKRNFFYMPLTIGFSVLSLINQFSSSSTSLLSVPTSTVRKNRQDELLLLQYLSVSQPSILPLMEWEIRSTSQNQEQRICSPPTGIPAYCCLGTTSSGGEVSYNPSECKNDISVHEKVANYTIEYLNSINNQYMINNANINYNSNNSSVHSNKKWLPKQDCDICRIIDYLLIYNWTLAIQGDSLSRQTFTGFECELHRRGYTTNMIKTTFTKEGFNRPPPYGWRAGITDIQTLTITIPSSSNKTESTTDNDGNEEQQPRIAKIVYYAIYRPAVDNVEIDEEIVKNSDIVVFDHGLHWQQYQSDWFVNAMKTLLRAYKKNRTAVDKYYDHIQHPYANYTNFTLLSPYTQINENNMINNTEYQEKIIQQSKNNTKNHRLKLVAWRQTTSQHFNSSGGHYTDDVNYEGPCKPHEEYDGNIDKEGYRYELMKQVAKDTNFTLLNVLDPKFFNAIPPVQDIDHDELIILPYRDYTAPLHYFHPNECSHYCNDPHLWLPIWKTLRLAMDRTVQYL